MNMLLPAALRRLSPRILLLQGAGNAVFLLLALAWLQIPDSHIWQLVFSLLAAAVLVMAFLALQVTTLQRLRRSVQNAPLWLGMLLLAAWLMLFYGLARMTGHLGDNAMPRAGYWNSQLSPHWRTVFTFDRLNQWQNDFVATLIWVILPILILPLLAETVVRGRSGWRSGLRVLRRWQHWVTVAIASWTGCWSTSQLLTWHPANSVRGELISVVLRVGLVYVVDLLLAMVILAVLAELLSRDDAARNPVA